VHARTHAGDEAADAWGGGRGERRVAEEAEEAEMRAEQERGAGDNNHHHGAFIAAPTQRNAAFASLSLSLLRLSPEPPRNYSPSLPPLSLLRSALLRFAPIPLPLSVTPAAEHASLLLLPSLRLSSALLVTVRSPEVAEAVPGQWAGSCAVLWQAGRRTNGRQIIGHLRLSR